jgi:hypothetical protein
MQGPQGEAGPQGNSVTVTAEQSGTHCAAGGEKIQVVDANGNPIGNPAYVCNGATTTTFNDTACDPAAVPDPASGIFVDPASGDDTAGTGDPGSPVKTIPVAVALAQSRIRANIYLAEGTYPSTLQLPAGTTLYAEGGWLDAGGAWHRDCSGNARALTIITGGVVAGGAFGGLRSLSVLTAANLSNIAVRVTSGTMTIRDCVLQASAGSSGVAGSAGAAGANGSGNASTCGSGANGAAGTEGSVGVGGTFASDGTYVPGAAGAGTAGGGGAPGVVGASGSCQSCSTELRNFCPIGCKPELGCCDFVVVGCFTSATTGCGVGGPGGQPGSAGTGGGASVALSVGVGASVKVFGSALIAENGGSGAAGGAGGAGGAGSAGAAFTASCASSCAFDVNAQVCNTVSPTVETIAAGGNGGAGGQGGNGGGGAGGPSFSLVQVGTGAATVDGATTLTFGTGGQGASGAPNGAAAATFAQP